ncbi:cysteine desulfurase family protein [Leucobacter massiliensis]|uniref:cysteine desulfurase n=1 Tax=Leucobacter massiliensis TaxID=1686285 RepID=A0A2S9QL42_9MICO|nr:cysteine desulfurase family protein [Leucobacter massiliensis]PRI10307.1 cysteine desulfurase [Leucobacter massiliensis]
MSGGAAGAAASGTGGRAARGYLDAAATAPLRPEARAALLAVLDAEAANPSSVHAAGHRARVTVEEARGRVAAALGARPAEVIFTSGGTEANNLAIIGLALANPRGRHLVTTAIEHPSVLESCRFLERVFGFELGLLPVDRSGRVDPAALAAVLRADTTLVSVGLANGEVGTVQPVPELAAMARRAGALVHCDAVQAAASLPLSFGAGGWPGPEVDAMTVASHKFGGPQGAGALLLRQGVPLEPLLHGGGQEGGARSGTENVAAIAGFGAAARACATGVGTRAIELMRSRDALIERVLAEVPGARLTGHPDERLPGHASFTIEGVSGESLLVALDAAGYAVSSGSACAAGKDEPSPVLLALGLDPSLAQTAIRFTLPAPLGVSELDRIVAVLRAETGAARAV